MAIINYGESGVFDYGPGGSSVRPLMDRFIKIFNNRPDKRLFLPDRTANERRSVYRNIHKVNNVSRYTGQYAVGNQLYRNVAAIGTGPCWTPNMGGSFNEPPAAPTGFTDTGVFYADGVNPNDYGGSSTIRNGTGAQDLSWQAFQYWGWGCPDGSRAKVSVRRCYI